MASSTPINANLWLIKWSKIYKRNENDPSKRPPRIARFSSKRFKSVILANPARFNLPPKLVPYLLLKALDSSEFAPPW